jgi:hypothetical protein
LCRIIPSHRPDAPACPSCFVPYRRQLQHGRAAGAWRGNVFPCPMESKKTRHRQFIRNLSVLTFSLSGYKMRGVGIQNAGGRDTKCGGSFFDTEQGWATLKMDSAFCCFGNTKIGFVSPRDKNLKMLSPRIKRAQKYHPLLI